MDTKIVDIAIGSDLYVAGRTEDGRDYIAENYFVTVEYSNGEVFRHRETFLGCKVEEWPDEDGYGTAFIDVREEAKAGVERLFQRVKEHVENGGKLAEEHWTFYRTIYGSGAYLDEVAGMTRAQRAGEDD